MKQKIVNQLNSQDIFGYIVQLNFNRNGNIHTTILGGVISIILKCLYIFYLYILFDKLLTFDDDKTYIYDFPIDEEINHANFSLDYRNLNL